MFTNLKDVCAETHAPVEVDLAAVAHGLADGGQHVDGGGHTVHLPGSVVGHDEGGTGVVAEDIVADGSLRVSGGSARGSQEPPHPPVAREQ